MNQTPRAPEYQVTPAFMLGTFVSLVGFAAYAGGPAGVGLVALGWLIGVGTGSGHLRREVRHLQSRLADAETTLSVKMDVNVEEVAERALDYLIEKHPELEEFIDRYRPELTLLRPGLEEEP